MTYLGIIDWGIGGLGLHQHLKQISDIPTLYFSDAGFTPYGKTDPELLQKRIGSIVAFLREKGASHIAIACNSANAAFDDRENITGIINHGIAAMRRTKRQKIGLLAGRGTVASNVFSKKIQHLPIELVQQIAQPLSAHIEAGRLEGPELHNDLHQIMRSVQTCNVLLLACTHYPAIIEQIRSYVDSQCIVIDPAVEMADWITKNWSFDRNSLVDEWLTTGSAEEMINTGMQAFHVEISDVKTIDVNALNRFQEPH